MFHFPGRCRLLRSVAAVVFVLTTMPAVAATGPAEPTDPVDQAEIAPGGWVAEGVADFGRSGADSEIQLYRTVADGVALGAIVGTEAARLDTVGLAALASLGDSERLPLNLALSGEIVADRRWRPREAAITLLTSIERGAWSADANLALRQGLTREVAGQSYDYAWALRARVRDRLSLVTEGGGRIHASAQRRAAALRGHFLGLGVALADGGGRELGLSIVREARWARAPLLLRCAVQLGFARSAGPLPGGDER